MLDKDPGMETARLAAGDSANKHLPLRLVLAFADAGYERRFVAHYADFYYRYAQVSLGVAIVLLCGDLLADYLAFPDLRANFYRVSICIPLLAAGIIYSFQDHARKHWQPFMAGFVVVVSLTIFWVLLMIDSEGGMGLKSWVGILNFTFVEFFCFVILGIQFRYALMSGMLILAAFEYGMWFNSGLASREAAYLSYHVVTLFMLTAGIGWWREFLIRQDFSTKTSLDEARQASESIAQVKSEFLANMSHEIRTPLHGVLGLAQIGHRDNREREAGETFARILHSGKLLLNIVDDILDFSKLEAGKLKVEMVPFELDQVLHEAAEPVLERAKAKAIALSIDRAPGLPAVCQGDPLRLTQILLNFLSNAVKFTERGGVTLSACREDDTLVFRVVDTGIGMDAEQIDRIFVAFQQVDTSSTRKFGGTGLGLTISRRLASLMGGEIRVFSNPGEGSTFELRLPYVAAMTSTASATVAKDSTPAPAARLSGISVLVAEDNEVNQLILTNFLTHEGAKVVMVENGRKAVEQVIQNGRDAFDIVLMDIQMREMDGHEATRRILELAPGLPIIGQTAHALAEEREKSLAAGMLDQIAKPISIDVLVATVLRHTARQPGLVRTSDSAYPPNCAQPP